MRFYVDGFEWEAKQAQARYAEVTHDEALAAYERVPLAGRTSKHYAEARAALSVCDWAHALLCSEAAAEAGDPMRWQ